MPFDPNLLPGDAIDNQRLCEIFGCGPQGGMRKSNATNTLVIVSNHVDSIYYDRWIGETFHYTGMGREGDQSLKFMQNKTLAESQTNGVDVHLFDVWESKVYSYVGRMILAGVPYQEPQEDENGNLRQVWVFPLSLAQGTEPIAVASERVAAVEEKRARVARRLTDDEVRHRAENARPRAGNRTVQSQQYERDQAVAEHAKRRAAGQCQLCLEPAPFRRTDGEPYLETHHIVWLAHGGDDSIQNTVALCPNCHRKMHVLDREHDRATLRQRAGG